MLFMTSRLISFLISSDILPPSQNKSTIHFVSECLGTPATVGVCQRHFLMALGVMYNVLGVRFACIKGYWQRGKICEEGQIGKS